jgi:hypothetical protein
MIDTIEVDGLDEDEEMFRRAQVTRLAHTRLASKPRSQRRVQKSDRHIGCPLPWFQRVYPIARGKGDLAVWLWLWRLRSIRRNRTVKVSNKGLAELGISRFTKYRSLKRFAEAGLISIRRDNKNALEVVFRTRTRRSTGAHGS